MNSPTNHHNQIVLPIITHQRFNTIDVDRNSSLIESKSNQEASLNSKLLEESELLKQMRKLKPIKVSGKILIDENRKVLWR